MTRRKVLSAILATAACALAKAATPPSQRIPQKVAARVIVDNDFGGDPDGLFALAHQLLSPIVETRLVTVSLLDPMFSTPGLVKGRSVELGVRLAEELIRRLQPPRNPMVVAGQESVDDRQPSAAARAIVAEAMREDSLPLFFCCGGPLTNLAAALRLEPRIAARMTLIWIGGEPYPLGGPEYNLACDPAAARAVIEGSQVPVWQVTRKGYRMMAYSIAEFESDIEPVSSFTRWLYQRFTEVPDFVKIPGAWPMGDTPLVILSSITRESSPSVTVAARRILADLSYGEEIPGRTIEVFDHPDARLAFSDFRARLVAHAAKGRRRLH